MPFFVQVRNKGLLLVWFSYKGRHTILCSVLSAFSIVLNPGKTLLWLVTVILFGILNHCDVHVVFQAIECRKMAQEVALSVGCYFFSGF